MLEESSREHELKREECGHFSGLIGDAGVGARYRFRLDGDPQTFPDPASRFQPEGPHGPSQVIDPSAYKWSNPSWRGIDRRGRVISEVHVGTFTVEGTYAAAAEKLPLLIDVGIDVIELMPLHEFPGEFGWGYDGVDLWAPAHLYGSPDDLRRFIDAAHQHGIGVILDVVYNHFGPDGCYLRNFTESYFTDKYVNDWGEAVNFDGNNSPGVREFVIENAAYWIDEFHFDGLRLDATQSLHDQSDRHIIQDICSAARTAAGERSILIVAENEPQHTALVRQYGVDAIWNDDWHHAATVALGGRAEAYYTDYQGSPREFVSMAKFGLLFQGQWYDWQKQPRGTPSLDLPADRFVEFIQNHDQIANSASGKRIHQLTSPGKLRAMTALLLLAPQTPMLFQGEEFAASAPFLYFADHKPELAHQIEKGRKEFMKQFPSIATDEIQRRLPNPNDRKTFEASRIDWSEREKNASTLALHRDLIALRRSEFRNDDVEAAVLDGEAFLLRWISGGEADRLLLINLGPDLELRPASEPLLAPPQNCRWEMLWSSESAEYGGSGIPPLKAEGIWRIPGQAAVLLRARNQYA